MIFMTESGELDLVRVEVGQVFRNAGYLRPTGSDYLAVASVRRFPHCTFGGDDRRIVLSGVAMNL